MLFDDLISSMLNFKSNYHDCYFDWWDLNPQGTRIVVEPCRPKPDAPLLDIQKEFKGWRHDFELGFSYKQHRFSLEQEGVRHYLSPQLEDTLAYPHEKTTQTCSGYVPDVPDVLDAPMGLDVLVVDAEVPQDSSRPSLGYDLYSIL